ncbi:transposase [Chryseobacterium limigenitum]|uniref:Helix-turn-helix domain-containing protein n=1 Tax=Chryseobacterium limigenitum TaxID=1612149 RepID=A0A1K2IZ29_9FLAO|nr:transposase [Chryseobacterium limigenitum]SFZ97043.1 hypothetical protein SAMN05216324_13515 [Chryseobacterium limigenitum]
MKASEQPDYKKIFDDIIKLKYPDKKDICNKILAKDTLSILDVIIINDIIFGETTDSQKFRCYDKKAIFEILEFQKKYSLNNSQLARRFKLSRNSITKWKKSFFV